MKYLTILCLGFTACGNDSSCDDTFIYPGHYAVFYEEQSGDCGGLSPDRLYVYDLQKLPGVASACSMLKERAQECTTEQQFRCNYTGYIEEELATATADYDCDYDYELEQGHKKPTNGTCTITVDISTATAQLLNCTSTYSVDFMRYGVTY